MTVPFVKITDFPFADFKCARPDECPVCQSQRCQFGRLGKLLDPQRPQCHQRAVKWSQGIVEGQNGIGWCEDHEESPDALFAKVPR